MKRDLLAAFTFILSGVLFYAIGHGAEVRNLDSTGPDCGESLTIMVVDEAGAEATAEISFLEDGRFDS